MDTEVRKPVEGPTVIHQSAPIHLVEIITRKSDNAVIKHTVTGMTSSDLKKLNVRGIHGLNLYNLKKGAALKLELEDVFIDLQLQKKTERFLILLPESDHLFEVFNREEAEKYMDLGCDDVTGIERLEKQFITQNKTNRNDSNERDNMSTEKNDKKFATVTSPKFRMSFPHLYKPHSGFKNQEPVYSIQMLFPKKEDLLVLKKAAHEAAVKKFGPDKTQWPQFKHQVFKDGDLKKNLQGYEGMIVVEARSKLKPGVVDGNLQEVIDPSQAYAGRWARATLTCYAYNNMGNAGVSFGLQNVQLLENDTAFSGRKNAKDDFGVVEGLDDGSGQSSEAANYDF